MPKRTLDHQAEESIYKPDLKLLSKYQGNSSELLKLALIFLADYGFLLKEIALPGG
jgi:hypothetical protein